MELSKLNAISKATDIVIEKPSLEIGQAFSDIFYLIFGDIHRKADKKKMLNEAYNKYFQEVLDNIKSIPQEDLKDPDLQKVANALVDSKFCVEKEVIRKMFVNLISASMNEKTDKFVHPSFSAIIKQMDTLDAHNLMLFQYKHNYPIVHYQISHNNYSENLIKNVFLENPDCQDIERQSASISCLENFGLVKVYEDTYFFGKNDTNYKKYYETEYFLNACKDLSLKKSDSKCSVYETYVELTPLGDNLLRVCLK